ncbi:MAG: DUF1330 domain-containing protein [Thiohalophilus sp.]|jgi:uncharacterized protein (DUF1330 family)
MEGYIVFNYRINDQEAYQPYLSQVMQTLIAHNAEILVADFESETIEGDAGHVTVVLKFSSKDAARKWYQSPEYQNIIELRTDNCEGIAVLADAAE